MMQLKDCMLETCKLMAGVRPEGPQVLVVAVTAIRVRVRIILALLSTQVGYLL